MNRSNSAVALSKKIMCTLAILAVSLMLTPANALATKKNNSSGCLQLVDVSGPLHVERDQFGRPTVIGTPACGPKHGVNSYWYQVGKMWAEAECEYNFAVIVYGYLEAAGRLSEFIVDQDPTSDLHMRRITFTTPQYEQQLEEGLAGGAFPEDIIDFLNGVHQGYVNHIQKIKNGEQVLPADFVDGVGILNWFWSDVSQNINVAQALFTIPNYLRGIELANDFFGSTTTAFDQLIFGYLFGQLTATQSAPVGQEVDAVQITNDILGVPSFNFRYTAKEGDRAGIYCPLGKGTSQFTFNKKAGSQGPKKLTKKPARLSAEHKALIANLKKKLEQKPKHHASDFLIVGKNLTSDSSVMMFGNEQSDYGFDGNNLAGLRIPFRFRYNTPLGAYNTPSFVLGYTRSETGYGIICSAEVTQVASRDGVFEDSTNLTLIYNSATGQENVPGGFEQSVLGLRQADGTVIFAFIEGGIYQGNSERPGLEFDFRFPDPDNPENEFVYITRHPCDWMKEASGYLKGFATFFGMVPFSTIEQFAENLSTTPFVLMLGGFDDNGNIFTMGYGLYPTITTPDFNRVYPQDATSSKFFESMILPRTLPVPADGDYACIGSKVAKNSECGFFTAWNNMWSNDDQIGADTSSEENHRVSSIFRDITAKVKEKGKLNYKDLRDLWTSLQLQRSGSSVFSSRQNYGSNAFPAVFRDDLFEALSQQGLAVGLTPEEIERTFTLLGERYDGRSIPNVDIEDRINGTNYDGRWVLAQLWISILHRNLWTAAIPDQFFRETIATLAFADLTITEPTADWTPEDPFQSRVNGVSISSDDSYSNPLLLRILKIGPDLGNQLYYDWYGQALVSTGLDLTNPDDRAFFIAQALKDALEFQVTGSNAGTGLDNPNLPSGTTPRANLNLIQDNGIPLHPGWGKGQRPVTLGEPPYVTQFLVNNFVLTEPLSTLNAQGQLFYAQRDCKGCLKHFQGLGQVGYSSLLTTNNINGEQVVTVQPHATDMIPYFHGNLTSDEIPMDICPINPQKTKKSKKQKPVATAMRKA